MVSAVNRGYNGAIIVTGQGGCEESVMVEGGGNAKAKGILLHSIVQMLEHQSKQTSNLGQQTAGKDGTMTEEYKSAQKIHLAFSAVMIGDDGHMVDLLALNSTTPITIAVDKDGESEFCGIKKKPVFTAEEARHVINRVVKSRERNTSAARQPTQTIYTLQMERQGKKRRSRGGSTSSSDPTSPPEAQNEPVTGRLVVAALSSLTKADAERDQADVPGNATAQQFASSSIDDLHGDDELADQPAIPAFMKVLRALAHQGSKIERVPYRKAKLTQVLRGALGGNCRTNVIVAVNVSETESQHTGILLDFASNAREIRNTAVVSRKFKAHRALMSRYRKQLDIEEPPSDYDSENSDDDINAGADAKGDGAVVQKRRRNRRFLGPSLSNSELNGALPGQIADDTPKVRSSDSSNTSRTIIDPFARGHSAVEFPEEDDWDIGRAVRRRSTPRSRTMSSSNSQSGGLTSINEGASVRRVSAGSLAGLPDLPELPTQVIELSRRASMDQLRGGSKRDTRRGSTASIGDNRRGSTASIGNTVAGETSARARNGRASNGGGAGSKSSSSLRSHGSERGTPSVGDVLVSSAVDTAEAAKQSELEVEEKAIRLEYEEKLKEMSEKNSALLEHFAVLEAQGNESTVDGSNEAVLQTSKNDSSSLDEQHDGSERMWTRFVSSMSSELEPECSGSSILKWIIDNIPGLESELDAYALAQSSMDVGALSRLDGDSSFDNANDVQYQFTWEEQLAEQKALRHDDNEGSVVGVAEDGGGTFFYSESGVTMRRTSMEDNYENDHVLPEDPLLLAIATNESLPTIRALALEYGTAAVDTLGRTAIAYCVIVDNLAACKSLCKFGADVNIPDTHGHTPLLWASYRGSVEMMHVLLKNGAFLEMTDNVGRTALHWATRLEGTECVKLLLKYTISRGGDTRYFVNLQDRREQLSALHWAVAGGKARAVQLLVQAGADAGCMDAQGRTSLAYGNKYGARNCFREIIKHSPSMIGYRDAAGRTALHLVCGPDGVVDNVAFLLTFKETNVNAPDLHLRTPLHWAATYNRVAACKLLVHGGARRDAVDTFGRRPIDLAVAKGNMETVVALGGNEQALEYCVEKRASLQVEEPEDFTKPQEEKKQLKRVKAGSKVKSTACIIC